MRIIEHSFQAALLSLGLVVLGLVMLASISSTVIAAENDAYISEQDCAAIRDNNGIAPKSIPADVVEQCNQIPLIAPAAGAAAADPCADGGSSIYCWGPWESLAPAAGSTGDAPVVPLSGENPRPEVSRIFDKDVDAPPIVPISPPGVDFVLPLDSCPAGSSSCGFATVVDGSNGSGNPDSTSVVNFDMASDGTSFTVDPGNNGEIQA